MITAYTAYRLKQQRANESEGQVLNTPSKKKSNDPAVVLAFAQKTVVQFRSIDMAAWTDEEIESIRATFVDLKKYIDGILNPKSEPHTINS